MISDEAVEAAAKVLLRTSVNRFVEPRQQALELCKAEVRPVLEAAAPHMLAEAQTAAWESGKDAVWAFLSNQDPQRNRPANPYRSQA